MFHIGTTDFRTRLEKISLTTDDEIKGKGIPL